MPTQDFNNTEYELNNTEKDMLKELVRLDEKIDELSFVYDKTVAEYNEETELLDAKYEEKLAISKATIKPLEIQHTRLLNKFWEDFLARNEIECGEHLFINFDSETIIKDDGSDEYDADCESCEANVDCKSCEANVALRAKIKELEEQLKIKKLLED